MSDAAAIDTPATAPVWEKVHFVSNYFDIPLEGLVDVDGVPHVFFMCDEIVRQRAPEEIEEGDDDCTIDYLYALHPCPPDIQAQLLERNAIFERWHHAWSTGASTIKEHPALPDDRARYDTLKAKLTPWIEARRKQAPPQVRLGDFRGNRRPVAPGASRWQSFEVQWGPREVPSSP